MKTPDRDLVSVGMIGDEVSVGLPVDPGGLDGAAAGRCRAADWRHRARLRLLRMHYESGVGHLGGNLSCLDLMLVLHHDVLGPADQFVLSKGHSAGRLLCHALDAGQAGRTTTCDSSTRTARG